MRNECGRVLCKVAAIQPIVVYGEMDHLSVTIL